MQVKVKAPSWAKAIASDLTDMDRAPQAVEPGAELDYELPDDVYFQYAFVDDEGKLHADPEHAERADSVWYGEVSEVRGPEFRPEPLAAATAEQRSGAAERLKVEPPAGDGPAWRVSVVSPPGDHGELPLVIAQDGVAFFRIGRPHLIAAELLATGEIRPARFAFIEPHHRTSEYGVGAAGEAYQRLLAGPLEEELRANFPTGRERVYLGASLGAAASARAALERVANDPELAPVTSVLSFSGAFLGVPGDADYYRSQRSWLLERLAAHDTALPARWQLEIGSLEWLLDVNRRLAAELDERADVEVAYRERNAGHNWTNWRNGLADALRFALAPERAG